MADEMNDRSSSLVQALFTPRGVALIGASGDPTKNSGRPQRFLKSHGFTGAVYPINPGRDEVQGVPAFKSVADVPGPVDHAFVMVPAQHVEDAIRQCGEKGVPVATIYSDGFAETGEDGRKMQERLVATARKAGVRLIGPNSMGVIHPASSLTLSVNAVLEMEGIKPGGLSLISQSGTILGTLLSRGAARGIGFAVAAPDVVSDTLGRTPVYVVLAGLLVGFGTQLGSGCTSGHGICGLTRFSPRSLVAVLTFMATGAVTAYIVNHVILGGAA